MELERYFKNNIFIILFVSFVDKFILILSFYKCYILLENKLIKIWKSIHKGPVVKISFLNSKNLMASGGSDGSIRLWNLQHHTCMCNIKGIQGVIRYIINIFLLFSIILFN